MAFSARSWPDGTHAALTACSPDGSMAPRSRRVVLSRPSSLPGHSDSPNARDRPLSVSSDVPTADHRWSRIPRAQLFCVEDGRCPSPSPPGRHECSGAPFYLYRIDERNALRTRRGLRDDLSLTFLTCRRPYSGSLAGACPLSFPAHVGLPPKRTGSASSPPKGGGPTTGLSREYLSSLKSRSCTVRVILRPASLASIPDRVKPRASQPQSRHNAVSGHVQPIRYRMNPPSASVPERGIGTTTTFTLHVREFHTSYTPAFSGQNRAVTAGNAPNKPPKRYAKGVC